MPAPPPASLEATLWIAEMEDAAALVKLPRSNAKTKLQNVALRIDRPFSILPHRCGGGICSDSVQTASHVR